MLIRPVLRPTITLANLLRLNLAIKNIHWQITPLEITRRSWHKLYPLIDMFAFYNPKRLFFAATNSSVVKISCSCTTLKPLDHFIIDLARGLFLALRSFKAKYPLHNFAFCVLNIPPFFTKKNASSMKADGFNKLANTNNCNTAPIPFTDHIQPQCHLLFQLTHVRYDSNHSPARLKVN